MTILLILFINQNFFCQTVTVGPKLEKGQYRAFALKGAGGDILQLLTTFLLTVFVDLTVAIEIGMVLAAFIFMRKMIKSSDVSMLREMAEDTNDDQPTGNYIVPKNAQVFEISGPLFFGAAYKFKDAMHIAMSAAGTKVLIVRMRRVPIIDATGIRTLRDVLTSARQRGIKLILSEVDSTQVLQEIKDARLLFAIGKANVASTFEEALGRYQELLAESVVQTIS